MPNISLFLAESLCPELTDEQFCLFHTVDRELFSKLVDELGRDSGESMQVLAFFLWLEREIGRMGLTKRISSLTLSQINLLAEEAVTCLKCVENDRLTLADSNRNLKLLPLVIGKRIGLRLLHKNRTTVLIGVADMLQSVCSRAFKDILERISATKTAYSALPDAFAEYDGRGGSSGSFNWRSGFEIGESSEAGEKRAGKEKGKAPAASIISTTIPPFLPPFFTSVVPPRQMLQPLPQSIRPPLQSGAYIAPPATQPGVAQMVVQGSGNTRKTPYLIGIPVQMAVAGGVPPGYELKVQNLNSDLAGILSRKVTVTEAAETEEERSVEEEEEGRELDPDDRTIFLTFSKGFPISEDEVREFFTRKFGDFIEDLIMQGVGAEEQVLYARMVSRTMSIIDTVVGGSRAKYNINGKHVWARKYTKKSQPAASGGSGSLTPRNRQGQSSASSSASRACPNRKP